MIVLTMPLSLRMHLSARNVKRPAFLLNMTRPRGGSSYSTSPGTLPLSRYCSQTSMWLRRQGKVLGGVYVGRGQEAIPVGSALVARADDVLFPSHRDMAVFFIRGVSARRVLAQYMGRVGGLTRGRDGNMHMGDMSVGVVSIISALAATVPVRSTSALAMRYKGIDGVAFSYFGD